ncbi:MAG: MFS transporter [Actinocatenispora sp.]
MSMPQVARTPPRRGRPARPRWPVGSAASWSTTTSSSSAPRRRWSSARSSTRAATPPPARSPRWPPSASGTSPAPSAAWCSGHFGDRLGRKRMLVVTLLLMGTATFLVGLLPGYGQLGIAAPVLLVALRLLQGFSAGGEQAGANSMTLEHAPPTRRAFFTSFTLAAPRSV